MKRLEVFGGYSRLAKKYVGSEVSNEQQIGPQEVSSYHWVWFPGVGTARAYFWNLHVYVSSFRCAAPRGQEPRWSANSEPTGGFTPAPMCRDPG